LVASWHRRSLFGEVKVGVVNYLLQGLTAGIAGAALAISFW
jgi:hypothetical protein